MSRNKGSSWGGLIALGVVMFAIGRCSGGHDAGTTAPAFIPDASTSAQAFVTSPAPRFESAAELEAQQPMPEPYVTTDPQPEEPSRHMAFSSAEGAVYYPNCSAVRAAGAAPIHVGEPGYTRKLDRDGDGVACE